MPHKKSPKLRAGCLRAYKSGNEIMVNLNIKNNTLDLILNKNKSGTFSHNTAAPYDTIEARLI